MSGLPPKPEVGRTSSSWPEPADDRRYSGRPVPMAGPDHYRNRRDDRDRDRERDRDRDRDRDRERDRERSYHPPRSPPPRSPPPRGRDTYTSPSRNDSHRDYYHRDERSRGERGWEPDRRASERRDDRAWTRDEHTGRGRGRGRGRASPRRGTYQVGSWRVRDSERDRDYGGRNRSREYDRNNYDRRRFDDRERSSTHRPPYSPRQDSNERRREHYSPTKSPRRSYSPRRHSRPPSPDGSTHRHSPRSPVKHEPGHSPHPPSAPRSHYSDHRVDDRRRGSQTPSPRPARRSLSRDTKPEPAREETHLSASPARSLRAPDEKTSNKSASPHAKPEPHDDIQHVHLKVEPAPEDAHVGHSPASSSKTKDEPADQDAEGDFKMRDRSPDPPSHSPHHAVSARVKTPPTPASPAPSLKQPVPEEPPAEMPKPPTAPYLPPSTRRETLKDRLGQKYKDELSQIEAIEASRSRAASEQVQISKAVRRALHELDITTIDLRAAQIRREHAENHRKKAATGFLDIDAEFSTT
ncbi:hypothetical protein DEU56DRAFT_840685 [Suillus clintonianus]|uniref:uncharacterized protein n=1 Tax=Suillus clintonianus TaxID=1904413 RepID=UPI001B86145D|nr:uncharacterized protein DEU56DRAFT_840685 [Suillus clintonianus]KAG2115502.1 hypothetical protein DEU56DRAFT_840685 [Suillus clintonianus]